VQGTLLREPEGLRLVIGVELLQRAVAVEVDPQMITPLANFRVPQAEHLARRIG
jgi:hypothetical protein